ncbi:retrovirus-related pol polyprotein from transposon TNT 1-94 [Tanacetum coccineum]
MHNNIMAAGSRDRPPMLATGRYAQWRSRFLRYIDTRPNGDALWKCILKGPYTPTIVTTPAVPATEDSPAVPEQTTVETVTNMTPENRAHFESEKERVIYIDWRIGDENILNIVDVMSDTQEMWAAAIRAVNVVRARETVGAPVVQQSGIQCFNCKEFGHYAKECRKPKRVKDFTYPKEKMLLCKQAEKGVQLQAEQSDWLADTDEEIDEQELEAHYKLHGKESRSGNDDSNVTP